jgi:DNA-damage-inducible protein J
MRNRSSTLHIKLDRQPYTKALEALSTFGLTPADAVRFLFHRIAVDQAFPLELKIPNAETKAAMREAEAIMAKHSSRFGRAG